MSALESIRPAQLPWKTDPTECEQEEFLAFVRDGFDPSRAAGKVTSSMPVPRTAGSFRKFAKRSPEFAIAYAEAMETRAHLKHDQVDDLVEKRATEANAPPALVLGYAARWHEGYRREARHGQPGNDEPELRPPPGDLGLLTTGELEEFDSAWAVFERLIPIIQGRAPSNLPALEAGAA